MNGEGLVRAVESAAERIWPRTIAVRGHAERRALFEALSRPVRIDPPSDVPPKYEADLVLDASLPSGVVELRGDRGTERVTIDLAAVPR